MTPLRNICFFKDESSVGISEEYYNAKAESLALEISGDGAYQVIVEGQIDMNADQWTPLAAIDLQYFTVLRDGISKNGVYTIAVDNIQKFRVRISSISGTVTVFGRSIEG